MSSSICGVFGVKNHYFTQNTIIEIFICLVGWSNRFPWSHYWILLSWSPTPPELWVPLFPSDSLSGQGVSPSTVWERKQADFTTSWHWDWRSLCQTLSTDCSLSSRASWGIWEPAAVGKKSPDRSVSLLSILNYPSSPSHQQPGFPTAVLAREESPKGPRRKTPKENALSVLEAFTVSPFPASYVS